MLRPVGPIIHGIEDIPHVSCTPLAYNPQETLFVLSRYQGLHLNKVLIIVGHGPPCGSLGHKSSITANYRRIPSVTSRRQMYSPEAISTATPAKLQTSGHSPQITMPSTVA